MLLITPGDIQLLVRKIGLPSFLEQIIAAQEQDFGRWEAFQKSPRHATHYPHGVIELMPWADDTLYAFKYVNGHPRNTRNGMLSVTAVGMLAEVASGYPLMFSEMTLLTALRTAATTALGARYLARPDTHCLALIGTGAQAEFQLLATQCVRPIREVRFYDPDADAMAKFQRHMQRQAKLIPCASVAQAAKSADMVITATASKRHNPLLTSAMIAPGTHIHGLGGDCPGKTELDPELLSHCKVVVEYLEQSQVEGEIQNCPDSPVHAELWELVKGIKEGRATDQEITLLDSVGIALEDYSILRLVYEQAQALGIGQALDLVPDLENPKDLFGLLSPP